jgi:hypothetical protein
MWDLVKGNLLDNFLDGYREIKVDVLGQIGNVMRNEVDLIYYSAIYVMRDCRHS